MLIIENNFKNTWYTAAEFEKLETGYLVFTK